MRGRLSLNVSRRWRVGRLAAVLVAIGLVMATPALSASDPGSSGNIIARGGGTTIIGGGTGAPDFVPVLTTIAFHAEKTGGRVTGSLDCLALAPEAPTGSESAKFTVNAMYVTGQITGAAADGKTATLTGTATITGLGAGSNVPFTLVVREGGPGATVTLTVETLPGVVFREVLVDGSFEVKD